MTPRGVLKTLSPLLACIGLLCVWQVASLRLDTESFPTALEAIKAVPSILGDKESLLNIARFHPPHGDRPRARGDVRDPARPADGPHQGRRVVLQSADDDHLSGAESRADADHHAVDGRRRRLQDAGDLPRRQPADHLSLLPGRQGRRREDAVVGRCDGHVGADAHVAHRAAGGAAGNSHGLPHRPGAGADHHDHLAR